MRDAVYRFGDVTVEAAGREVRRAGARVPLEPKALDVLLILLAEAGRVVDKRRLLREVWADVHVTDSSLARAVTHVRRALGDDHRTPRFVETVPTRGYRFIGALQPIAAADPDARPRPSPSSDPPTGVEEVTAAVAGDPSLSRVPTSRARRGAVTSWVIGGVTGLALVVGWLAVGWLMVGERRQTWAASPLPLADRVVWAASAVAVQLTTARGADVDPTWSPDGNALAYATDESGAFEIHVRPRIGEASARAVTTNGGDNVSPAWSPDGQWLAYHSRRHGGVWIVPAAGGAPRQLVPDGGAPAWSPDGRSIAFQSANEPDLLGGPGAAASVLTLVDVASGAVRALTHLGQPSGSHGRPTWLPDGRTLAFVAATVPAAEVWTVTLSGEVSRLADCAPSSRPFVFHRGRVPYLAMADGAKRAHLWMLPLDGPLDAARAHSAPLPTTLTLADLSLSPDGRFLAFSGATRVSEVWSVPMQASDSTATGPPTVLLHERRPRYGEAVFSPDGGRLAFTTLRAGDEVEAWIYDLQQARTARVGAAAAAAFVKGWTADGHLLVLDPATRRVILRVDTVTGRAAPFIDLSDWAPGPDTAHRLFTLRVAPGERRYVYAADDGGRPALWVREVGGGPPRRVTATGRSGDFPAWSRDGRSLAFQSNRGWRTVLSVQRLDGSPARALDIDADHAWVNDWSPDGRHLVAAAMRQGRWTIDVVDVARGTSTSITPPGDAAGYVRWPVWSPTGDRIVYERGFWTGNLWVAELPES